VSLGTRDERHLARTIELACRSRQNGNHPFGSLLVAPDGAVVLEAENTVLTERDWTGHAELNLVRAAGARLRPEELRRHTLYASTEPCAMCTAAAYWAGVGRIVYALGAETLRKLVPDDDGSATLALSCREVLARGGRKVEVSGPHLEREASAVHDGYW
jgi:tRNA(Arg) A34 adenosine deaminase TadA